MSRNISDYEWLRVTLLAEGYNEIKRGRFLRIERIFAPDGNEEWVPDERVYPQHFDRDEEARVFARESMNQLWEDRAMEHARRRRRFEERVSEDRRRLREIEEREIELAVAALREEAELEAARKAMVEWEVQMAREALESDPTWEGNHN